ncbi:MAG: hypothetical protein KF745_08785 [Phycisphaeraceae bacterium]|nr:hypothetical protein [Phycisphaeraceae bacterium]
MGHDRSTRISPVGHGFLADIGKGVAGNKATELIDWLRKLLLPGVVGAAGPVVSFVSNDLWAFMAAITLPLIAMLYLWCRMRSWLHEHGMLVQMLFQAILLLVASTIPGLIIYRQCSAQKSERTGLSAARLPALSEFAVLGAANSDEALYDLSMVTLMPLICGNDRASDSIRIEVWVLDPRQQRLVIPNPRFLYNWPSQAAKRYFDVSDPSADSGIAHRCFFEKRVVVCSDSSDLKAKAKHFEDIADAQCKPSASILCAPIFAPQSSNVVGVVAITSPAKGLFMADDERIALNIAAALQGFVADRSAKLAHAQ